MLRGNFSFLLGWKSSVELKQPFKLPALQHRVNYAENDRARTRSGSIQAEALEAKSSLRQQLLVFFSSASVHVGEKPFSCKVCFKAFVTKKEVRKHRRAVHSRRKKRKKEEAIRSQFHFYFFSKKT